MPTNDVWFLRNSMEQVISNNIYTYVFFFFRFVFWNLIFSLLSNHETRADHFRNITRILFVESMSAIINKFLILMGYSDCDYPDDLGIICGAFRFH